MTKTANGLARREALVNGVALQTMSKKTPKSVPVIQKVPATTPTSPRPHPALLTPRTGQPPPLPLFPIPPSPLPPTPQQSHHPHQQRGHQSLDHSLQIHQSLKYPSHNRNHPLQQKRHPLQQKSHKSGNLGIMSWLSGHLVSGTGRTFVESDPTPTILR